MPDIDYYFTPFILSSLIVAAGVELAKHGTWFWYEHKKRKRPATLRRAWRVTSVLLGCLVGLVAGGVSGKLLWYDGLAVGCGAGLLSTSVIAVIQKLMEKKANG